MSDSNYLDYTPSILEYNQERSKKLRVFSRNLKKQRKSMLKNLRKNRLKAQNSSDGIEFDIDNEGFNQLSPKTENGGDRFDVDFGNDSSEEEEIVPIPNRSEDIKIKSDKNFVSFMPLPDEFHKIVTMAEFIKKIGLKKLEEDEKKAKGGTIKKIRI